MKNIKKKIYHKLINNELRYNNKSLVRYENNIIKKLGNVSEDKLNQLKKLKIKINSIKNCDLKNNAKNLVFADGNPNSLIMIIG